MGNTKENYGSNVRLIGKTIRDIDSNSTVLIIPSEFAKALGIENSRVLILLLDSFDGNRHLVVSKYHMEIVID